MSQNEQSQNLNEEHDEFESEELAKQEQLARERVGDEKVDQRLEQLANLSIEDTMAMKEKADAVMAQIATCKTLDNESAEMQSIVQQYLMYSNFALSKLQGKAVVIDHDRFLKMADSIKNDSDQKAAFEQFGEGTAAHFSAAMAYYAEANLK